MTSATVRTLVLAVLVAAATARAHATGDCEQLLDLQLTDAHIETVAYIEAPIPHCKATGAIGGKVGFSVWLPTAENWNGRFLMGGAGGFVRAEDNQAMRYMGDAVLTRGYVTASSDTGHKGDGLDNSWALNDWEAIVNYGHLGMHRTVTTVKAVISGYYAKPTSKSFFIGCSNGGRQGLQEAQRYPQDFDGIIAGAPSLDFTGVTAGFLNITRHMYPDPGMLSDPLISSADRKLLRAGIEAKCDTLDGVADGILHNPSKCDFDVNTLQCAAQEVEGCLSKAKISAIQAIYHGPQDVYGALHYGYPFGAEDLDRNGWGSWFTRAQVPNSDTQAPNAAYAFAMGFMRHFVFHDPTWNYTGYDWNNFRNDTAPIAAVVNAANPDLSAFRAKGGKLMMFHGWADVALSAHMSTSYVEDVYARDAAARDDVKLFMMPGVLHCFGGEGPSIVDWVQALEDWHDSGIAPAKLTATYPDKAGARTLCAWPREARFTAGNPDTSEAYVCE